MVSAMQKPRLVLRLKKRLSSAIVISAISVSGMAKEGEPKSEAPILLSARTAWARMSFRDNNFIGALAALDMKPENLDEQWIYAESLFRLERFLESKAVFEAILSQDTTSLSGQKAAIRIFECNLFSKNLPNAITSYNDYKKRFKNPGAKMNYLLAKALYDAGYQDKSVPLFKAIPLNNEFSMRAKYILASIGLKDQSLPQSVKAFNEIEKLPRISVEDYAVRDLAILAQARIYADAGRDDLAAKAYSRVPLTGAYAEDATAELVRIFTTKAESIFYKEGKYRSLSPAYQALLEDEAIATALSAIENFRKKREITWKNPELHTVMAFLFAKSKRYDEAEIAYAELINHYRGLNEKLTEALAPKIWPYFALKSEKDLLKPSKVPIIESVPDHLLTGIIKEEGILAQKSRIESLARDLELMKEKIELLGLKDPQGLYARAEAQHKLIVDSYYDLVLERQMQIVPKARQIINTLLAEAEFRRGEIALLRMRELKKQIDVVRDFQTLEKERFEKNLAEKDKGGSP
jgi:hypothetical protein